MKVNKTPSVPNYAALRDITSLHDANYGEVKLARTRAIYGALYQRMLDTLFLDDEGYEVTITLRSASKTLTLNEAEVDKCFNLTDIYEAQGKRLDALSAQILDLLGAGDLADSKGAFAGTTDPDVLLGHALCMPQPHEQPEAAPTTARPRRTAAA
jgi:hypothetical protein